MGSTQSVPSVKYRYNEIRHHVKVGTVLRIPSGNGQPDKFFIITDRTTDVLCVHLQVEGELKNLEDEWIEIFREHSGNAAANNRSAVRQATYVGQPLREVMNGQDGIIETHDRGPPDDERIKGVVEDLSGKRTKERDSGI
jgi:hypothetical protein